MPMQFVLQDPRPACRTETGRHGVSASDKRILPGLGICDGRVRSRRQPWCTPGMRETHLRETPCLGSKVDRLGLPPNSRFYRTAMPWQSARGAGRFVKNRYLVGSVCPTGRFSYRVPGRDAGTKGKTAQDRFPLPGSRRVGSVLATVGDG